MNDTLIIVNIEHKLSNKWPKLRKHFSKTNKPGSYVSVGKNYAEVLSAFSFRHAQKLTNQVKSKILEISNE